MNIKGISSMNLHRVLKMGQKPAWFMLQRLREAFEVGTGEFLGSVEAEEIYFGGKRKNISSAKRKALNEAGAGRGTDGKAASARKTARSTTWSLRSSRPRQKNPKWRRAGKHPNRRTVYTDDAKAYQDIMER